MITKQREGNTVQQAERGARRQGLLGAVLAGAGGLGKVDTAAATTARFVAAAS